MCHVVWLLLSNWHRFTVIQVSIINLKFQFPAKLFHCLKPHPWYRWSHHWHIHRPGSKYRLGYLPTLPQTHSTGQNLQMPSKPLNLATCRDFPQNNAPTTIYPSTLNLAHPKSIYMQKTRLALSTHLFAAQLHPPNCSLCPATSSLLATYIKVPHTYLKAMPQDFKVPLSTLK